MTANGEVEGPPVVSEASFLLNRGPTEAISGDEMRRAISISWGQARRLLLLGTVNRLYTRYPAEALYVGTRSGKVYLTKVTQPDDLWSLTKLVDPCGVYISIVQP